VVKLSLRTRLASLAPMLVVAILSLLLVTLVRQTADGTALVDRTYEAILASGAAVGALTEADTGVRRFLLTGDEAEIAPLTRSAGTVAREMDLLETLTADNPAQRPLNERLQAAADRQLILLEGLVAARRREGVAPPAGSMSAARAALDEAISAAGAIEAEKRALLAGRTEAQNARLRWLVLAALLGGALAALATYVVNRILLRLAEDSAAAAADARSANERLVATAAELEHANAVLQDQAAELEQANEQLQYQASEVEEQASELSHRTWALEQSEARLRRIIDSNMIGVLFWRMDGGVTFANDAFLGIIGSSREDLAEGRVDWRSITPPEWDEADALAIRQLETRGVSEAFEKEYLRRDGTRVSVLLNVATFPDQPGEGVTLVTDLSERRASERAAAEAAELRRLALDAARLGTWELDLTSGSRRLDARALEIFGMEDTPAATVDGAPPPHGATDVDRLLEQVALAAEAGESVPYEHEFRTAVADGEFRWTYVSGKLQRQGDHRVRVVGTVRDVTARHRAEQAIREGEARFRATFDQAAVGIAHVDVDGRWLRVNERLCSILGYAREDLLGLTFQDITHPDDLEVDLDLARQLEAGEIENYRMEKRYRRPDGSFVWAQLTGAVVRTDQGGVDYFIAIIEDIQRRKELEARLVASEKHLWDVIDSMSIFVGVMTPDGTLLTVNRAALQAASLRSEDVIGRPFDETDWWNFDRDIAWRLRDSIVRAAAGEPSRYDVVVRLGPDDFAPIDFMLTPVRNEEGAITHLVASAIVISERVQAESTLRERETMLRTALSAARMGTWDIDLVTGDVRRSDSTDLIFGLTPTGEHRTVEVYMDRVHPDDRARVQSAIALSVEMGLEHRVEYRIVHPDGGERWVSSRGEVFRDENGSPERLVGALVDETARHRAETALRESEERFRTLADNIPQLAWMADPLGSIFWFNRRWFDYTGSTPEEMEESGWGGVLHPDHAEQVMSRFMAAVDTGDPWEDTFPLRGADGRFRWFLSRAQPIRDGLNRVVRWFGTNTDVTEQREADADRERLFQQAQSANRARAEFMAVMSHELRTPLNAILGYTDLLQMGVPESLPEGSLRYVDRIRFSAQHQKQVIEDVLTFSRVEAGREATEIDVVEVDELLREITAVIAPLAEQRGLALLTDAPDAPVSFRTDARKLRQILLNLLGNAVKFTNEGYVSLRVCEAAGGYSFTVEDTGIGIAPEHHERMFEAFWQGDRTLTRTAEGTGLGLSISRRFAQMIGGGISVVSAPGRGSTFTLWLPDEPAISSPTGSEDVPCIEGVTAGTRSDRPA